MLQTICFNFSVSSSDRKFKPIDVAVLVTIFKKLNG